MLSTLLTTLVLDVSLRGYLFEGSLIPAAKQVPIYVAHQIYLRGTHEDT